MADSLDDRSAGTEPVAPAQVEGARSPAGAEPLTSLASLGATTASPAMRAGWLVRAAALIAVLAAAVGVVIARGLEGNVGDRVVAPAEKVAATLAYFMGAVLVGLIVWGAFETVRIKRALLATRIVVVAGSAFGVAMVTLSIQYRLPWGASVLLCVATALATLASGINALRAPHTRAVGVVLGILGIAALARLTAWEIATSAGDSPLQNEHVLTASRAFVTAGVVLEGLAQLIAAAWLGTRSKAWGQLLSSIAILCAFVITWGVAQGASSGVLWQQVVRRALGDAMGNPPPFGLNAVAVFLASAGILLALVAAVQPGQVVVVVSVLSLALVSRGTFDVPLRALAALAASHWLTIAMGDDRAMWRVLLESRNKRIVTGRPPA